MAELQKDGYIYELIDVKNKLKDFIELINKDKFSYFKEIAVKLRMLYSDVNRIEKSSDNTYKSLLKIISEFLNIEIKVYTKSYSLIQKFKDNNIPLPIFLVNSAAATWFDRGDELTDINIAITKELIYYNGEEYSFTELFRIVSDKLGGCHIDRYVSDNIIKLYTEQFYVAGNQILVKSILDMAAASIKLIEIVEDFTKNSKESEFITVKKI